MIDFLDATDEVLRQGAVQLSPSFRSSQIDFVLSQQAGDGGFGGSAGPADLYYTDFAVRCLVMLDGPDEPLRRAAGWVEQQTYVDLVHCLCSLNTRRLLRARGISLPAMLNPSPAAPHDRAYGIFLSLLIRQLRQEPSIDGVAAALADLRRPDGGFAESSGGMHGHTNATAAALASLWMTGETDATSLAPALDFLTARQTAEAGFSAHAGIDSADLLSTFTALLSLAMLGRTEVDLAGAAQFLRACARPAGGFAATPDAAAPVDVEYTWYGVGLACLLRQLASISS